jgi:peptidoglycan hydrolase-like protein with peptidoglycan-binding domain
MRGYLLGVVLAATTPRGRFGTLAVTVAALLLLGSAANAAAQAPGAREQSTVRPADLLPEASWHGRAIERPDPTPIQFTQPVGTVHIAQGAGLGHPGGTPAVREIQRRLRALGYRLGPIDGLFGPMTRSAVGWFQIKHRLAPTGAVDGATLAVLRFRTGGSRTLPEVATPIAAAATIGAPAPPTVRPIAPVRHVAAPTPAAKPAAKPVAAIKNDGKDPVVAIVLAAIVAALLAIPEYLRRRKTRAQAKRVPARPPVANRGRRPETAVADKLAAPVPQSPSVMGYAVGRDEASFARQRQAIERLCVQRGWDLGVLVKERSAAAGRARRRPGLNHVLGQISSGAVTRLVVARLDYIARTPTELISLLDLCRRCHVELVAMDVGLDTATPDGRLAIRCLGALAGPRPHAALRNGNGKRNGNGHVNGNGRRRASGVS